MDKQIIVLLGAIKSDKNYKKKFDDKEKEYKDLNYIVINPTVLPQELSSDIAVEICKEFICHADVIYFFKDWRKSEGTRKLFAEASSIVRYKLKDIKFIYEE